MSKKPTKPLKKTPNKKVSVRKHLDDIVNPPPSPELIIEKVNSEVREAVRTMTVDEARFLVDAYYEMQKSRIRSTNQISSINRGVDAGPNKALKWIAGNATAMEQHIVRLLKDFAESHHMGRWALNVHGIGPIISAALLAFLDQTKPTAGHIWSFFGYNPRARWLGKEKADKWVKEQGDIPLEELINRACAEHFIVKENFVRFASTDKDGNKIKLTRDSISKALARRPWNATLKTLGFKIGDCFIKGSNSEHDVYGHIFRERKATEEAKNEKGDYADQAAERLRQTPNHAQKSWYAGCFTPEACRKIRAETDQAKRAKLERELAGKPGSGVPMLPPGHILSRARRYAVKWFLADWQQEAYRNTFGKEPPLPYPIAILGHAHHKKSGKSE